MTWVFLKQVQEYSLGLFGVTLEGIDSGKVYVRLVEGGHDANALFETLDRIIPSSSAQIKYPQVV